MHANQDLVNFAINRLRDGRTPGQIKKEMHKANLGWHGFEISSAIAAAIKETAVAAEETSLATENALGVRGDQTIETSLEKVDSSSDHTFQNIHIDWPLLDVTNAWGLLTATAIILIILTALVAIYFSL